MKFANCRALIAKPPSPYSTLQSIRRQQPCCPSIPIRAQFHPLALRSYSDDSSSKSPTTKPIDADSSFPFDDTPDDELIDPMKLPINMQDSAPSFQTQLEHLTDPALGGRWSLTSSGKAIERTFRFGTFKKAWAFMRCMAKEIQRNKHHPEWTNVHNRVHVRWTTHNPPGLFKTDLKMARECDEAAVLNDVRMGDVTALVERAQGGGKDEKLIEMAEGQIGKINEDYFAKAGKKLAKREKRREIKEAEKKFFNKWKKEILTKRTQKNKEDKKGKNKKDADDIEDDEDADWP